jgi:hypothetical protein
MEMKCDIDGRNSESNLENPYYNLVLFREQCDRDNTTKNSTISRVSTVLVTVDTRPISHVYTVHVARRGRITVGRVYFLHAAIWPSVFFTRG